MGKIADDPAVKWLERSPDPSVRYLTLVDVLGYPRDSREALAACKLIPKGPKVRLLLSGQRSDGGFGVHPYQKWTGAHWRLVSLVELAIPRGYGPAVEATDLVLDWLTGDGHRAGIKVINGLTRRCASQEGNALGVCSYLGLAEDPRVKLLAESLAKWQWPDGGWNCDKKPEAHHSSFAESLSTLWGVSLYVMATGDREAARAKERAAEFFLSHRLFRSHRTGKVIKEELLALHYPLYWHYDILQALRIISMAGKLGDPRTKEALDIVEGKRRADGVWHAEGYYWTPFKESGDQRRMAANVDIVDWGRGGPNEMITLNALRVLKASGRIS
ncbi:MAG TPA: hypothetical protein VMS77_07480 [Conexivisphaerales archaeon]|nr:hypothetical protein [Conexivisphaerales archaeon]